MKRNYFVILLIAVAIFASCSGFDKILKSNDYQLMYKKALEYYEAEDHYRYTILFERLVPIYKGTQQADTVEFFIAQGYYNQGDYLLAGHYFDKFRKNYPRSQFTEEAEYMYAYCFYRSSPRPLLDQETTQAAISAFTEFITKYPRSDKKAEVNKILVELRQKLVEKAYLNAKLYYDMEDYKAAITAFKNSLAQFPNSDYREEQLFMILKASYKLADNSVPEKRKERFQNTLDEYYNLMGEFPETMHKEDAEKMYANTMEILDN
ncbi:MAG: outer membrane protein assembly factor BamD [Bacteroidales bacterium]